MLKRLNPVRDKKPKVPALPSARISNRVNKACKFFPCHSGLEDCTFCYCPLYPCLDKNLGRYVYSPKRKKKIWSCKDCSQIHKSKVAEGIFALIRKNKYRVKKGVFLSEVKSQKLKNGEIGIIILSHGSKLKKANAALDKTVRVIKQRTGLNIIVPAYLQFCQPNLAKSVKSLITQECQKIIIIPFFLLNGNHVTRDIPEAIKKQIAKYPGVRFIYTKNLGEDVRIADVIVDIAEEAIHDGYNY